MITAASLIPQHAIIELADGREISFKPLSVRNKIEILNRIYPTPTSEVIDGVVKPISPIKHQVLQTAQLNQDLVEGNTLVMVRMLYLLCEQKDQFKDVDHFSMIFTQIEGLDETNAILYTANVVRGTHDLLANVLAKQASDENDDGLKKILMLMQSKIHPITTR